MIVDVQSDDLTRRWATERAGRLRRQLPADTAAEAAPEYGTEAWAKLADNDPRRWLAVINAAELRRLDLADRPRQLEAELSAARCVAAEVEAERFAELARWVRATAGSPSYDELQRRRAQPRRPAGYAPRPWPTGATA